MNSLLRYYSLETPQRLHKFLEAYIPLVKVIAEEYDINLDHNRFSADHLGLQVISKVEFDACDKLLLNYCRLIYDGVIHERRNRVYQFHEPLIAEGILVPRIESFEPKPGADIRKLRPGVEHIAFKVNEYGDFLSKCESKGIPIDKSVVDDTGSKFFKTKFLNCVEIEFRNDYLMLNA